MGVDQTIQNINQIKIVIYVADSRGDHPTKQNFITKKHSIENKEVYVVCMQNKLNPNPNPKSWKRFARKKLGKEAYLG